jgi:hypothetical protein
LSYNIFLPLGNENSLNSITFSLGKAVALSITETPVLCEERGDTHRAGEAGALGGFFLLKMIKQRSI